MKRTLKRTLILATTLAAALLVSACGGESSPDKLAAEKPTSTASTVEAKPTVISPEELAKRSAASAGYSMKVMSVEDPAQAAKGYAAQAGTRLVAVQLEFTNVSSDDKMIVDIANATITDDKGVDYASSAASHDGELKAGDLAKSEKTSGWVGFAVPTDVKLKSVTYRVGLISIIALTADLPKQ